MLTEGCKRQNRQKFISFPVLIENYHLQQKNNKFFFVFFFWGEGRDVVVVRGDTYERTCSGRHYVLRKYLVQFVFDYIMQ